MCVCVCVCVQMAVVLEGMADGGVMTGIPRAMSQRIAAHTMLVNPLLLMIIEQLYTPSMYIHCLCILYRVLQI